MNDQASAPPHPSGRGAESLPLALLLDHVADAVQSVRAGRSLTDALARCPAPARPPTQALSFHVLRWLGAAETLRRLVAPKTPPAAVDALLLSALALLWPAGGLPYADHTLVDQAVEAARRRAPRSAPFINAVLRRVVRDRDELVATALVEPLARFNHPAWWIERLQRDWPRQWQRILDADNQHPPMTLRVNARRATAAGYVERLARHTIAAQAGAGQAVTLERPLPVTRLPGFADGDVSVQDAAAQLAARLLLGAATDADADADTGAFVAGDAAAAADPHAHADPAASTRPGRLRVLDACAAPGGKTAQLLELADLDLLALDSSASRLERVEATLARLGLHARLVAADAGDPAAWWDGVPFDAILLDAPCSASGIVRRHPDVRWLRRASDIAALAQTQARLLDALWPLLRRGGRLLYCTCSVFKAEGREQIDAFLQRHADARESLEPRAPGHLLPLPDNDATPATGTTTVADGFFLALLDKTEVTNAP